MAGSKFRTTTVETRRRRSIFAVESAEAGAPIKRIENQSSGVIPVMKMLEDAFSYANQLGARQGLGQSIYMLIIPIFCVFSIQNGKMPTKKSALKHCRWAW